MSHETLRRALERDQRIQTCPGKPMEMQRVHVPAEEITERFWTLRNTINNEPTGFVWNVNRNRPLGLGRRPPRKTVHVPADFGVDQGPIPVDRARERITLATYRWLRYRDILSRMICHSSECHITIVASAISRTDSSTETFLMNGFQKSFRPN